MIYLKYGQKMLENCLYKEVKFNDFTKKFDLSEKSTKIVK